MSLSKYDGFIRADDYFDKRIASSKLDGYKVVQPGEWAFSTIHIDEGSIARNNLGETGVISPMYTTMRFVATDCMPEYAELLVRQPGMLTEYSRRAQGSINRRRSLPFKAFAQIEVSLPTLVEQRRIVEVMATVDAQIEALVEETARTWGLLSATRNDLLSSAPCIPLSEVCEIRAGLVDPRLEEYASLLHVGVDSMEKNTGRIIGARSAREDGLISGKYLFEPGDVIYSKIRPVLRKVSVPDFRGLCSADAYPLRPKGSLSASLLRESLLFEPVVEQVVKMSGRTKMPKVNRKELFSVNVPVLEVEARAKIDSVLLSLRAEAEALETELAHLRTFRSTLLTSLLNQESEIPESYDALLEGVS